MRRKLTWLITFIIALFMIGVPLGYMRWSDRQQRNDHARETGVAYRSAQMSSAQLQQAVAAHNIRTIVSLQEGD